MAKNSTYAAWGGMGELYTRFLHQLKYTNSMRMAAEFSGIKYATVIYRRAHDPPFKKACQDALDFGPDELEHTLRDRAVNGLEEPVYWQGEIVGFKKVYDNQLGFKLLQGQKPEKYGNKVKLESDELSDLVSLMTAANARLEKQKELQATESAELECENAGLEQTLELGIELEIELEDAR